MLSLDVHQPSLARAILQPEKFTESSLALRAADGADASARLGIYRNNTIASLTSALLATFPVTAALLDERFFRFAAWKYIAAHPPRDPRLARYGLEFARFLSKMPELRSMRFVAETARLEFQVARALDEPSLFAQPVTALAWIDRPEAAPLQLQPSLGVFMSRWPAAQIWAAHKEEADPQLPPVRRGDLERFAVWRNRDSVRLLGITKATATLIRSLQKQQALGVAAEMAARHDQMFDLATELARLFGCGLVTAVGRKASRN
jgi:hypothetical protein